MLSNKTKKLLARQLKFPQKSIEWLNARYNLITSSDVAAVIDCNMHESSLELLKRKCSSLTETPLLTSNSIQWGEKFEPIARDIFESITEEKVTECGLVIHEKYKWLGASPDGVLNNAKLLEIKCPYHRRIVYGSIPYYYWIQVQIQMECCDANETYFLQCQFEQTTEKPELGTYEHQGKLTNDTYWGLKKYTLETIKRDTKWFNNIVTRLMDYWNKIVYYRGVGAGKLMADVGNKQVYYNLNNESLEIMPSSVPMIALSTNEPNDSDKTNIVPIPTNTVVRNNNVEEGTNSYDVGTIPELILSPVVNIKNNSDNVSLYTSPDNKASTLPTPNSFMSNKRKRGQNSTSSPIIRPTSIYPPVDWSQWVSATSTRNYAMKEPLLDWLNEYGKGSKRKKTGNHVYDSKIEEYEEDTKNSSPFFHYLQAKGISFEEQVVVHLYKKFRNKIVNIANPYQARQKEKYNETIAAMDKGVPIIYQGVLHNEDSKTYGISDLLVRSDFLNQIFKTQVISESDETIGCKFSRRWHYRVIDIKHSTLALRSDGKHLLNSGSVPAYKTQLYVYNQAISKVQNYTSSEVYVLGRKWGYTKCGERFTGNGWFDTVGVINYNDIDAEYAVKAEEAVKWIRLVRNEGHKWSINPPSRKELYPNMKNQNDNPWHSTKEVIATNIGEITSVWMCGIKNRDIALNKGITTWKDSRCTAKALGINGLKVGPTLDAILNINRGNKKYAPSKIKNKLHRYKVEFFVDFETINDIIEPIDDESVNTRSGLFLFMIGVGWRLNDGKQSHWKYKNFTTEIIDFVGNEEKNNFIAFHEYISDIVKLNSAENNYIIYHWSHAEKTIYEKTMLKYEELWDDYDIFYNDWYDLLDVFKDETVVIKGAFNFSLKSISRALFNQGYIKTVWEEDGITDGLNAMVKAVECSNDAQNRGIPMTELPIMKKITQYNEVDCKVLLEILSFLRHNLVEKDVCNVNHKQKHKKRKLV